MTDDSYDDSVHEYGCIATVLTVEYSKFEAPAMGYIIPMST
jgi:hypothetical protein